MKKVLDNKKKHAEEEGDIKAHEQGGEKHIEESQNLLDDVDEDIIFWLKEWLWIWDILFV